MASTPREVEYMASTPRVWSVGHTRWDVFSPVELAADEQLLTRRPDRQGSAWATGSAEIWKGRHTFLFELMVSHKNKGNIHIGICDSRASAITTGGHPGAPGGVAFSFHPWDGQLYKWDDFTLGTGGQELQPASGESRT